MKIGIPCICIALIVCSGCEKPREYTAAQRAEDERKFVEQMKIEQEAEPVRRAAAAARVSAGAIRGDDTPLKCSAFSEYVRRRGHGAWETALIVDNARENGRCE